MKQRMAGKVAIVTGGNAGIGEAVAKLFAQEGASVVITGRRQGELDRVVEAIAHAKGKAISVAGSVTDEAHARETTRRTLETYGRIDALVNNAGIGDFGKRLHEVDDATWSHVLDVNVTGVFRMTRAVLPQMLKQRSGSIVNVSSIASLVGIPLLPAYAASKGALDALTRAMAIDYATDGIRCNVITPGLTETPMAAPLMANPSQLNPILDNYPIRRTGKPEEIAHMVLYLSCDESTWVTGSTLRIDGGMTAR
ncbi:3-oxoacyl-[acyl-carrier-protein] reductase FabG [Nitrospira sp. KM1]|uniref:SDR family NAD(P)-dependent oxidoreductase n=1 Tax=Nitrospira sp. KM1 TaxID=1936990 RepID=UPI0013A7A6DF|nr:SDR family oxidoreductase [Nitrospira sp. KM1]BCA55584.1 3-oxoacyl-[acyl-carrier-protein] reductase FabG [Nitrospira sp. KM1]